MCEQYKQEVNLSYHYEVCTGLPPYNSVHIWIGPHKISILFFQSYAYQWNTFFPYQVRDFFYVIPLVAEDEVTLICVDLVHPMVWV